MASPRNGPVKAKSKAAASKLAPAQTWQAWRIADGRFDPFSPIGASLVGGRWNSPGLGVIYASQSYAGAMLECLAHAGIGRVPRTHVAVEIAIAEAIAVERCDDTSLPAGWDHADLRVARAFGDAWIGERRTAVLVVPSVVARREGNVLINPWHPEFSGIFACTPEPVAWDARLFGFCRSIGSHGPRFVEKVLEERSLETDSELTDARDFIGEIWTKAKPYLEEPAIAHSSVTATSASGR